MKYSFGPIDSTRLHSCRNKSNRARSNQSENEFCLPLRFIVIPAVILMIVFVIATNIRKSQMFTFQDLQF